MEEKRLSLLSRFMEVTAKGTKNKQLKREWIWGVRWGVEAASRGEDLSSSFLVLFPTCVWLQRNFFFLKKEQKERKTWWGHKMKSRIRLRSTHHIDLHICCSGAAHLALSCAAAVGKETPGQRIPNTHDESKLILGENLAGSLLLRCHSEISEVSLKKTWWCEEHSQQPYCSITFSHLSVILNRGSWDTHPRVIKVNNSMGIQLPAWSRDRL